MVAIPFAGSADGVYLYIYIYIYIYSGKGNGNPLQYSCLGNPMDIGAWQAAVHGVVKESDMS